MAKLQGAPTPGSKTDTAGLNSGSTLKVAPRPLQVSLFPGFGNREEKLSQTQSIRQGILEGLPKKPGIYTRKIHLVDLSDQGNSKEMELRIRNTGNGRYQVSMTVEGGVHKFKKKNGEQLTFVNRESTVDFEVDSQGRLLSFGQGKVDFVERPSWMKGFGRAFLGHRTPTMVIKGNLENFQSSSSSAKMIAGQLIHNLKELGLGEGSSRSNYVEQYKFVSRETSDNPEAYVGSDVLNQRVSDQLGPNENTVRNAKDFGRVRNLSR